MKGMNQDMLKKLAYQAGSFVGETFAVPFYDGLMDKLEPRIIARAKETTSAAMPQLPGWMKRFL